jgi:hypothetical protein
MASFPQQPFEAQGHLGAAAGPPRHDQRFHDCPSDAGEAEPVALRLTMASG